jgi:hypothetical protein
MSIRGALHRPVVAIIGVQKERQSTGVFRLDGINRPIFTPPPLATSSAGPAHAAEDAQGAGAVNAVSEEMVQLEVRLISNYLKEHVFADHHQPLKPVPRDVSPQDLEKINAHNDRVTRSNQKLDDIADSRARVLQREGETLGDIADTLAKGERFDRMASRTSSAFRAIPFASATVLQYAKPEINKGDWLPTPLKPFTPLISGALSGVMDQVGTGVMNRVTGDAHYLKTAPENLHDAMADSLKRNAPGLLQKSVDMGGAIQSYSGRNALRTVVATGLAGHPKAQALVDTSISAAGGLVANAVFANRLHTTENRDHQRGGAYVFGRKDAEPKALDDETEWLEAYRGIKNASYSGAAINAGKRLAGMPIDVLTDTSKALRSLVSASSLTQNGLALAGGFAGVGKLQELATKDISNPYLKTAVSQLTNTAGSAAVFAGWTTAGVVTDPLTQGAEHVLQNGVKNVASMLANQTTAGVRATGAFIADTATTGADAVVTTGAALRAQYDNHVRRRQPNPDESYIDMA